ncbi:hypothetical protein CANINC_004458 [Pichia inconspicua]|uniref:Ribosome quality control complex subunit 1 n=1 Tax=Pichia inconspicua TaxID=52247 RepID=A0A4T0WVC2_9ASCO|nr:hypothetical protein CANINC_004458 [[Candida] inconspicua]
MSSRALKKLKNTSLEDELAYYSKNVNLNEEEESESEEDTAIPHTIKPKNAFSFLEGDSEDDSHDSEEESVDMESQQKHFKGPVSKTNKKVNKKAKNKNKKPQSSTVDDISEDELDKLLAEMELEDKLKSQQNLVEESLEVESDSSDYDTADDDENDHVPPSWPVYTSGGRILTPRKLSRCNNLLEFDVRDLNPDREYENLFGKLSAAAIDDADSTSSTAISPEMLSQIKKLAKRTRGWSGRDHRSIPGTTRKLKLTKIRDDWLPIPKKPLTLEEMSKEEVLNLYTSKFKNDWKEILLEDLNKEYKYGVRMYKCSPGPMFSAAAVTEFFMSVVVQPDHESLIRLLQKSPYSIETILQVANILQRQGDNSNTNGLIERALFVFDWSLPNNLELGNGNIRLPFEYFFNRQIYLTIWRYITVLTQKSILFTAFTYCKLLFSFEPRDDPYGVRYFIDHYAFLSEEYQYLIDLVDSPLCNCYEEWLTAPLLYTTALCYYKVGRTDESILALQNAYRKHPFTAHMILDKLGDDTHPWLLSDVNDTVKLMTALYTVRIEALTEEPEIRTFLIKELATIIETVGKPNLEGYYWNNLEEIPENIIRHAILSNESSVMSKIPESFWEENDVYEFDILPPKIGTTIYNYIDDNQISAGIMQNSMQAEEIRQLEDLLQQQVIENR